MDRSISSLPLASKYIELLHEAGFHSVESLIGVKPIELSKELKCTQDEALSVIKSLNPSDTVISSSSTTTNSTVTAKDYLSRRDVGRPIITFCKSIDEMIGGGIPNGQIVSSNKYNNKIYKVI